MVFIASADADGWPRVSYMAGEPGFVEVPDPHHLTFPVYDGNGMFLTAGDLASNPHLALLFVDWTRGPGCARTAGPSSGAPTTSRRPSRVRASRSGSGSARSSPTAALTCTGWRSSSDRRSSGETPVPDWKLGAWLVDTLPADDPALVPGRPTAPSLPLWPDTEPS
jgi:uncharacterized protein